MGECLRRAPQVFNTWEQPWVRVENGTVDEIVEAVERCPTGALHYESSDGSPLEQPQAINTVFVARNGPYYLRGDLEIVMHDGSILRETRASLCRCGASENRPFCDNAHRAARFFDPGTHVPVENADSPMATGGKLRITPQPNGSLRFEGTFELKDAMGQVIFKGEREWLCRCGGSGNKPFCDSTHKRNGFSTEPKYETRESQ